MDTAKRLYLYVVSAVSLFVLALGLYNLVAFLLGEFADMLGASTISGTGTGREQVSQAIALVGVGSPIFAVHWWLVGRGWRSSDEAGRGDRHSPVRGLHFGLVSTVAMAFGTYASFALLDRLFRTMLGADQGYARVSDDAALLLVALPVWWYHLSRRNADLRHDRQSGAAAWLSRLYRYGWAFVGIILLVLGTSGVIESTTSLLIGREGFGTGETWWRGPLAGSIGQILVGAVVFWIHGDDARRAIRDARTIGEDDRATALRATYFGAVILVALSFLAFTIASSLAELGRWAMGVSGGTSTADFLELVVGPPLAAVPFLVAGWFHWSGWRREGTGRSPEAQAAVVRLGLHLGAVVGGAFLAVGVARLLGGLFELAFNGSRDVEFMRFEFAWYVGQILVGAALWVPTWAMVMRRRQANPSVERHSTAGRAYLYLATGAALIAAVPSAAIVLYRIVNNLLGGATGISLGVEISVPLAVVLVSAVIAVYHARLVISDMRSVAGSQASAAVVAAPSALTATTQETPVPPVTTTPQAVLTLTLHGPTGTDLNEVVNRLRDRLPPGVVLEG